MPHFKFTDDSPEGRKRTALIKSLLPKKSIIDGFLQPRLMEAMNDVLIKALKKEIEIYKAYPKVGQYVPGTFNPRSTDTCFMGQGFRGNGFGVENWSDAELAEYRKAVGTIAHTEWGNCTLLEIWGGDHFEKYPDMVKGVMAYAFGATTTMPDIQFHINPFFKNSKSGSMLLSAQVQETHEEGRRLNMIANYIQVRDMLKAAGHNRPLDLEFTSEDLKP